VANGHPLLNLSARELPIQRSHTFSTRSEHSPIQRGSVWDPFLTLTVTVQIRFCLLRPWGEVGAIVQSGLVGLGNSAKRDRQAGI
jgi:hypothetical protein